jgi:hypothetical protein
MAANLKVSGGSGRARCAGVPSPMLPESGRPDRVKAALV